MVDYKHFKQNWPLFIGLLILSLVVIVNLFPKGYIFAGGDTAQLIEAKGSFWFLFYEWQGRACPFYFIFFLLDAIGVSDTAQLSWYLGIFVFGSFFSFYYFSRAIFRSTQLASAAVSLFYALNLFTLFIFTGNWGFSHFFSLYIFIPLIVGLFLKFLETKKYCYGFLFSISLALASSGFANPAFAVSFFLILFSLFIFLLIFKIIKIEKDLFAKLSVVTIVSLLMNAFWIFPVIPIMKGGVELLYSGNILDLNWWLSHTSNPAYKTFMLLNYSNDYFPWNYPYEKLPFLKNIFFLFSFLPMAIFIYSLAKVKKFEAKNRKYFFVFLGVLVALVMFEARVRPPFEAINFLFFNAWGLNVLRGWEKFSIFMPFVFSVLLLIFIIENRKSKWTFLIFFIIIITPLPFYTGKIQQNMSYRFSNAKVENKDYQKASLSFLVKIPEDYYEIRKNINLDMGKFFIATLPATPNDGSGIVSYPKWKLYGADVTKRLYNKSFIEANNSFFGAWEYAKDFNEDYSGNYSWIVKTLGMMNAKYIIYHKDAPDEQIKQSQFKMDILEKEGLIQKVKDTKSFNLYEISEQYRLPYISWQKDNFKFSKNSNLAGVESDRIRENSKIADFQEINPKKYLIEVGNNFSENIVLAEQYNSNWKAYFVDSSGRKIEIKNHFLVRGYANGWKIENNPEIKQILIEYYPLRLMWYGMAISAATALFLAFYLLRYYYVQRKTEKSNK